MFKHGRQPDATTYLLNPTQRRGPSVSAQIIDMTDYRAPANLPNELTSVPNWLVWRLTQKPGEKKPRKVPFYASGRPRAGTQGSPEDRAELVSYDRAVAACVKGDYTGVGIALLPGCGLLALDFDGCVDAAGVVDARVAAVCDGTYTEFSPSGTGIRAFMLGSVKSVKDNKAGRTDGRFDVEVFGDSGFVTVTGNVTPDCELFGYDSVVAEMTPAAREMYEQRFAGIGQRGGFDPGAAGPIDDDLLFLSKLVPRMGWSLADARKFLMDTSPDCDRDTWLKTLMAVHFEMDGSPEAMELAIEWSAKSAKFVGRSDVEGRWRSFGKKAGAGSTITGKWLLARRSEQTAHEKYDVKAEWVAAISESTDEFGLREKVCRQIAKDARIGEIEREALAQVLVDKFKSLGTKYPIAQCRKMIAEKSAPRIDKSQLPDWLAGWVYVSDDDQFYKVDSDEWLTMQGFNARFNRELPSDEDGNIGKTASWTALEDFAIQNVTRAMYLPWGGKIFEFEGVQVVNKYRPSSVPVPVAKLSPTGRLAVEVVMRHIEIITGGRKEVTQTFVDWLAHNVQRPGVKVRWAPLVKGVEGDGKSVLGSLLAAVMGRVNVRNVSPKVLGTDFTGWAEASCVVVLEEIKLTGHNRYDILNSLKPFVTNDSIPIHRKGKDEYEAVNTSNYIAFTNFADALPLGETDRRWWILFTPFQNSSEMEAVVVQKFGVGGLGAYFDQLHDVINSHRAELRRWLLDHKISENFKPNGSAPLTEEKAVMIGMSISPEEDAVREVLETGGEGVCEELLSSSCLSALMTVIAPEVALKTTSMMRVLSKLGYTRMPKKIKWRGSAHIVWVKGRLNSEPEKVRSILNKTLIFDEKGSEITDLL